MNRIKIIMLAVGTAIMTSCIGFKTEATVDVEVTQKGKPVSGVTVYKFDDTTGESATLYKSNASGSEQTNAAGVAHFDLKSPDDFAPSSLGAEESNTFYFATYDANDDRNAMVAVTLHTGEKKTVMLDMPEGLVNP